MNSSDDDDEATGEACRGQRVGGSLAGTMLRHCREFELTTLCVSPNALSYVRKFVGPQTKNSSLHNDVNEAIGGVGRGVGRGGKTAQGTMPCVYVHALYQELRKGPQPRNASPDDDVETGGSGLKERGGKTVQGDRKSTCFLGISRLNFA